MKFRLTGILIIISILTMGATHPCLSLTPSGIEKIRNGIGTVPLFDQRLQETIIEVDNSINNGYDIPIPKDMAGGYSHEQHKFNYKLMQKAGNLFQITKDTKYAKLVKDMLLEYAEMYPTLPLHPTQKSYSTGKIFWQCLNDANWLVFSSQAYDCIYDYLSSEERANLEENLFIPIANFLSIENPRFFNRIHNHCTWANAAVGMIALVMDNDTLLNKALYGLHYNDINTKEEQHVKAGFLAQLDYSFSPDGYFAEGPYYQRYAIFPFLKFSQALHNTKPNLDIFNYRDGILKKATHSLLQLSNTQGHFFPINDAQKGMSIMAYELVNAVDLLYFIDENDKELLSWASAQGNVTLDEAGYTIAQALSTWDASAPAKNSVVYNDGVNGEAGGVAVLRSKGFELLFKYSSQGMGHGHFDRLSYSLYDEGGEVIQDYGAARWVNVDQKAGGRYLPENKTFAKQTVAHNTVVIDHISQYTASVKKAEKHSPSFYYSDVDNNNIQVVSAIEEKAYGDTKLHRALFLIEEDELASSLLLDLYQVYADSTYTVDLPLWYAGHSMQSNLSCQKEASMMQPIGDSYGYQHIWKEATCTADQGKYIFTWMGNDRFYTSTTVSDTGDQFISGRLGANDPNFNLRSDPVIIHRKTGVDNTLFINLIESHGQYDRNTEIPTNPYSKINNLNLIYSNSDYAICSFAIDSQEYTVMFCFTNNDESALHNINIDQKKYSWKGVYHLQKVLKK